MSGVAAASWRVALFGLILILAGFLAIVIASIQGMAVVPGGSLLDGYDVGLLPWIEVGAWLLPIGGVAATIGAVASTWLGHSRPILRLATIPGIVVVLFWGLLAILATAPHPGRSPNGSTATSSVADFVYSAPANTVLFLLVPAALIGAIAAVGRRRRPVG